MWIYFAVMTLIILNCIGFYKEKILIWSVPVVLIAFGICIMFSQLFMGEYRSVTEMMGDYGIKVMYIFIFQFFAVSVVCSLITIVIRYRKIKKNLANFQKTKGAE